MTTKRRYAPSAMAVLCLAGCYLSHEAPLPPADPPDAGVCRLPPPVPDEPIDALCAFARGGRSDHPMPFVVGVDNAVVGIDATGTPVELHRFEYDGANAENTRALSQAIALRGDYAAAGIQWITRHDSDVDRVDGTLTVALVLLDLRTRSVVQRLGWQTPWSNRGGRFKITGSANGLFVFDVQGGPTEASSRFGVLSPDGTRMLPLEGLALLTDPSDDGVVGVIDRSEAGSNESFWLDLCALTRQPMQVQSPSARGSRVFGALSGAFDSPVRLAWESPEGTGPSMDVEARSSFQPSPGTRGRLLVDVGDPQDFRLYDTERGTFEAFRVTVPEELRRLPTSEDGSPYFHHHLGSTSDGAILLGLRDDRSGALYRSRDGQNWSRVGDPVGQVSSVGGWEVGGTIFVGAGVDFFGEEDWELANPRRIDGNSVQVVREASGLHLLLRHDRPGTASSTRHRVSDDGRCIAMGYKTSIGFIELESGNRVDIDLSSFGEVDFPLGDEWTWAMPSIERRM